MTLECKICGVSDPKILKYIINHPYPPKFIGFITNYAKSKRFVKLDKLKKLIDTNKKKTEFVAVLVKPNNEILENIKNYNKKIISAITVESKFDVNKYKKFLPFSDIILFDSKGYEKSIGFNHDLLRGIPNSFKKMIAGNIKINDILNFKNKDYIIDLSGALEDINGNKDKNKIDKFLKKINNL